MVYKTVSFVDWIDSLTQEIDDFSENFSEKKSFNVPNYPKSNFYWSKEKGGIIELALAGFSKENITMSVEDSVLRIKGKVDKEFESDFEKIVNGISERAFEFPVRFSSEVIDVEKINSTFKDGLLTVFLPMKEEAKPVKREIEIK